MSSIEETKDIKANLIIEIIGKPAEHLVATLEDIIKQIDGEKGVKVVNKKIKEPVAFEKQKGFFTTFAEIEIEVEDILILNILMFKYMPAHVEIISPELIILSNNGWNDILNELTRRLHGYDEVARVIQTEKRILENKLRQINESSTSSKQSDDSSTKELIPKKEDKKEKKAPLGVPQDKELGGKD
jgi:hypothetical protein|tara:strand:+ start:1378 stop:1935 length:558 start_codon:yes stop_codon:yes gene_type:complete